MFGKDGGYMESTWWVVAFKVCSDKYVFDVLISLEGHKRRLHKYILGTNHMLESCCNDCLD